MRFRGFLRSHGRDPFFTCSGRDDTLGQDTERAEEWLRRPHGPSAQEHALTSSLDSLLYLVLMFLHYEIDFLQAIQPLQRFIIADDCLVFTQPNTVLPNILVSRYILSNMGGYVFGVVARRLTTEQHAALYDHARERLAKFTQFGMASPPTAADKTTHGDLDILMGNWAEGEGFKYNFAIDPSSLPST